MELCLWTLFIVSCLKTQKKKNYRQKTKNLNRSINKTSTYNCFVNWSVQVFSFFYNCCCCFLVLRHQTMDKVHKHNSINSRICDCEMWYLNCWLSLGQQIISAMNEHHEQWRIHTRKQLIWKICGLQTRAHLSTRVCIQSYLSEINNLIQVIPSLPSDEGLTYSTACNAS
jgi:hypothetical protein